MVTLVRGSKTTFPDRNSRLVMRFLPFRRLKIEIKTLSLLYSWNAVDFSCRFIVRRIEAVRRSLIEGETVSKQVMFYCNHPRLSPATALITNAAFIQVNSLLVQFNSIQFVSDWNIFQVQLLKGKIVFSLDELGDHIFRYPTKPAESGELWILILEESPFFINKIYS
jgi:hypothetical protein